jgi:hypothetical protein
MKIPASGRDRAKAHHRIKQHGEGTLSDLQ